MDLNSKIPFTNMMIIQQMAQKTGEEGAQQRIIDGICFQDQQRAEKETKDSNTNTPHFNRSVPFNQTIAQKKEIEQQSQELISHISKAGQPKQLFAQQNQLNQIQRQHYSRGPDVGTIELIADKDEDEFLILKQKMTQIEYIASTEIKILRQQLEQANNTISRFQNRTLRTRDTGVNTEPDSRDQQIKALKQALIRHVRINKHLLGQINSQQSKENLQSIMNQVKI